MPLQCPVDIDDLNNELARIEGLIQPDTDTQDVSTFTRQADGSFDHVAGGITRKIPLDTTESDLDAAAIPNTQHGLSAGQLALPYNSAGLSSPAVTLWNSVKALAYSVAPRSIVSALYNSAVDGVAGVVGVRNTDGTIGNYSKILGTISGGGNISHSENGATRRINATGYPIYTLDAPPYDGHVLTIRAVGLATGGAGHRWLTLTMNSGVFTGLTRDPITREINVPNAGRATTELRSGETLRLVAVAGTYMVEQFNYILYNGTGWRENDDGTATMYGGGFVPVNSSAVIPLPVIALNTNYRTSVNVGNGNASQIITNTGPNTVSGFPVFNTSTTNNALIAWQVEGVSIDYTTI